jgi:nitroimidazol reductase NimA-like FMN-containing flavoprotein (pyridoxamine 5'-phosphate oxidase superfamily)
MAKRGHYDRATIDAILDAGILCHVGFVADGMPIVIPTLYWRDGDFIYLHGSIASRMLGESLDTPICVTVTHLDGLVLTRSAFHHSVNYRSVVVLGRAEEISDPQERAARMRYFMEGLFPGRWDSLRPVKVKELKATRLLRLSIDVASAKIRSGPPADDKADLDWPAWGGVIPVSLSVGKPEPDAHVEDVRLREPKLGRRL